MQDRTQWCGAPRRPSIASTPGSLLAVAVAASGVLLLVLLSHLTFFGDDWDPLLYRRGFNLDVLLRPHAEHILLGPTLIYKGIQATIGMEKLLPYAVVSTASFLASVVLLFAYLRRDVGEWLALAGVLPVLFMGNASEVLLWPFEVSFTASMATGVGALLVLERRDGSGDALACALLVASLAFSELALSFVLGAAVWMILARRSWSRAYVVVVPLVLYAAWFAGWGHTAQSHVSVHNLVHSPVYLVEGLASSVWSLAGVPPHHRAGGVLLPLLGLSAVAVLRTRSRRPLPASFWSALAILLSFWLLTAANFAPGREPDAGRYQYVAAVLLLLVLGNALAGIRLRPSAVLAVLAAASLATAVNLAFLGHYYLHLSGRSGQELGALAAFQVGGASADPNFIVGPANTDITSLHSVQVGPYLSAVDAFGSPTYGAGGLAGASEEARVAADQLLADAEELRPVAVNRPPAPAGPPPRFVGGAGGLAAPQGSCLTVPGGASPPVDLPRPGVTISAPGGSAETVGLRRFASSFPVSFPLGETNVLLIRSDRSPRPWQAQFRGPGPVRVCGLSGGPP